MIRKVNIKDLKDICNIYNYYVQNSISTFEENNISITEMKERLLESKLPCLVYENNTSIVGFAYLSKWKSRCSYRNSYESTIYLLQSETKKGIGYKLYKQLIEQSKYLNPHTIIGGISLPNASSVKLHEKLGYTKVANFKEVGYKFNKWIDVGYWQLIINN